MLLITLLQAHRPEKYRDNLKVETDGRLTMQGSVTVYIPSNGRETDVDPSNPARAELPAADAGKRQRGGLTRRAD